MNLITSVLFCLKKIKLVLGRDHPDYSMQKDAVGKVFLRKFIICNIIYLES